MEVTGRLTQLKNNIVSLLTDTPINIERLRTLFGTSENVEVLLVFRDKRSLSDKQRKLYRALLNDIYNWSGESTDFLHQFFKEAYYFENGKRISTANDSVNSKSDMNQLLDMVIDFMFEWQVPFKKGYELLPKNEQWYLFQCCKHRKCAVCGKRADIHHETNLVGMGGNRNRHNHSDSTFIALCRAHHTERHTTDWQSFKDKYHIEAVKLPDEIIKQLRI